MQQCTTFRLSILFLSHCSKFSKLCHLLLRLCLRQVRKVFSKKWSPFNLTKSHEYILLDVFSSCYGQLFGQGKIVMTCNKAQPLISIAQGMTTHEIHTQPQFLSSFLWVQLELSAVNDRSDHLSRLKLITAIDLYLNLARELQLASSSLGSAFPCLVTLLVYICKPLGFPQYLRKETDAFELLLPKSFCCSVSQMFTVQVVFGL